VTVRACIVSYEDTDGVVHSVNVHAASVFQAAVLGVIEFRHKDYLDDNGPGDGSRLTVTVKSTTTHELTLSRVFGWLDRKPRDGVDMMERTRLKKLLGNGN